MPFIENDRGYYRGEGLEYWVGEYFEREASLTGQSNVADEWTQLSEDQRKFLDSIAKPLSVDPPEPERVEVTFVQDGQRQIIPIPYTDPEFVAILEVQQAHARLVESARITSSAAREYRDSSRLFPTREDLILEDRAEIVSRLVRWASYAELAMDKHKGQVWEPRGQSSVDFQTIKNVPKRLIAHPSPTTK